ncbi:MAG: TetR family transcriptional regulator, partial [Chryseolinea sp.]
EKGVSTEEKIKEAARVVFTSKGFAATRTRDIAEQAGINLALLNYYFRSKEKLFELIMMEKMGRFFGALVPIFDNDDLSLEDKIAAISGTYIDLLTANPDLPIFILSELRFNTGQFVTRLPIQRLTESSLMKQLKKKRPDLHPTQFLMNVLGLTVFPFLMKPVLEQSGMLNEKTFHSQMAQRRKMIPKWIKAMLKAT